MAKPIKINEKLIEKLVAKFRNQLTKARSVEGEISFKTSVEDIKTEQATLSMTEIAYMKTMYLVDHFNGEVGWFGLTRRLGDREFEVYDILVYPQAVTSATVDTDEVELGKWENELSDEDFAAKRFHGHSHVNFTPTPSKTDVDDREQKIKDLENGDYYIFMIINKKREYTVTIYDLQNNIQYENKDINVVTDTNGLDFMESLAGVSEKTYSTTGTKSYNYPKAQYPTTVDDDDDELGRYGYGYYGGYNR